jgi:mannosyltransferase
MTTAAPKRRPLSSYVELPPIREVHPPAWFERYPRRLTTAATVLGLVLISGFLRSRQLSGQLWFDEAGAVGIASHSLGQLLGVVRHNATAPLYYVLLHIWIQLFGTGESATRGLSVVCTLLSIPAACWAGWALGGRRAGIFAAVLFAFSAYLTRYAEEAQPYALLALLALVTLTGFVQVYVWRRRRYLWPFTVGLVLMLYTQGSAGLFVFGALVAFGLIYRLAPVDDRSGLVRDAAVGFGGAFILFIPWLPATIYEIGHATAPWHYAPLLGADVPSDLMGGERVDATMLVGLLVGVAPLLAAGRRRSREAIAIWALLVAPAAGFALARVASLAATTWVARYFGPLTVALLLVAALGAARARIVGVAAIVLSVGFLANAGSFTPTYKSDMRDVAGEIGPLLHRGDVVVSAQPEQTPLAWYYLPAGLRFADTIGPVSDPTYMNWSDAQARLHRADPAATLGPLVASLKPGQQLLFVRPLTEGIANWKQPWTQLVRRRAAQWGQILTADVARGTLKPIAWAPHNYRSACCVANSATLYEKAS